MGQLVIFVLDLERGLPAPGIPCSVELLKSGTSPVIVAQGRTGADGCYSVDLENPGAASSWRCCLETGDHFGVSGRAPTFPNPCIEFLWDTANKLVLPVLVTAHAYTAYRGS